MIEALAVVVIFYIPFLSLRLFNITNIDTWIVNLIIIAYFVVRFGDSIPDLKVDISNIFSKFSFLDILVIVLANIFFSYGMLYLSNWFVHLVPLNSFLTCLVPKSIGSGFFGILTFISIVLVSPISEELIFRGVLLNKLKFVVPTTIAILVSSLLFASLHSFGSIFSAFIFGVCMAILYLKTDNILLPLLAHFLNNFIGEVIYNIDGSLLLFKNNVLVCLMSILAIVSFIIILKFIDSHLKNIK